MPGSNPPGSNPARAAGLLGHAGRIVVLALAVATAGAGELSPQDRFAPPLSLPDLDGGDFTLDELRGRVVLVNFWATWCPPCVAEMPALDRLRADLDAEGLVVVAVSREEPVRRVRHFTRRLGLALRFAHDGDGRASASWQVQLLPTSFLVDATGRLRYRALGEVDWDHPAVRDRIRTLLGEDDASARD